VLKLSNQIAPKGRHRTCDDFMFTSLYHIQVRFTYTCLLRALKSRNIQKHYIRI